MTVFTAVDATYHLEVEREPGLTLVVFTAPWCIPCQHMIPVLEQLDAEMAPKLKVVKVSVDESLDLVTRLHVGGVPTILLYRDGRELARTSKAMAAQQLTAWIKSVDM